MKIRAAKKLATLLAVVVTASFTVPAFADDHDHDRDRGHVRHAHPRPYASYQPGYVYAPPPVYYAPPPPPPIVPSLNIVVPLRIR
jgi:hypothetical protein